MSRRSSFMPLRFSILAALGLAGCGEVTTPGSGGSGGGGGNGGGPSSPCAGAVPVKASDGTDSGFAKCPDGTVHRVFAAACDPTIDAPACAGDEDFFDCNTDADCTAHAHGRCLHFEGIDAPGASCGCVYSCASDADCGQGGVCVCDGVVPTLDAWSFCAGTSSCTTGADCPTGECGISAFANGCGVEVELACRAPLDACRLDSTCPENASCVTIDGSGKWSCETPNCAIGRPLLVGGEAKTAPAAARADWIDAAARVDLAAMEPALRASLAAWWADAAAFEHASIASFARFTLELLSLGAPPDLLRDTQRAAADEVEHARLAYTLAGAYGERAIGPARLDVGAIACARSAREALVALIEEACVGETVGAAEARALAEIVQDPALAAIHARIAEDEGSHAELAWRAAAWLIEREGPEARALAAAAFERAIEAIARAPRRTRRGVEARAHGLLGADEIASVRRQAIREVVRPCADQLLGALAGNERGARCLLAVAEGAG